MGYQFQFVTLAGFHALNMTMFELAHAYRDEGMLAYSRLQQREFDLERDHGYRAVKHQAFVGAGYFDAVAQVVAAGHTSLAALRLDGAGAVHREDAGLHRGRNPPRRRRQRGAGRRHRQGGSGLPQDQVPTSLRTLNARRTFHVRRISANRKSDTVVQVIAAGQSSLDARPNGSTEQAQFTERTPVFNEAEIHHVAGDDVVRVAAPPRWVGRPQEEMSPVSATINARKDRRGNTGRLSLRERR